MARIERRILLAVFKLSRANRRLDASAIGEVAGVTPTRAATALVALERARLVDASRARLTMLGLATAVAHGATAAGGGGLPARVSVPPPRPSYRPEPLAALPEPAAACVA